MRSPGSACDHRRMQLMDRPGVRNRLVRPRQGRRVAGVAAALGSAFGIDPNLVRIAFVVLVFASGSGLVLYLLGWVMLPSEPASGAPPRPARPAASGRSQIVEAAALGAVVLGVLLLLRPLRVGFTDQLVWPVLLAGFGAALLWGRYRNPSSSPLVPTNPAPGRAASPWSAAVSSLVGDSRRPTRASVTRVVVGAVLVLAGLGVFLGTHPTGTAARNFVTALIVFAAGIALTFGPWLGRLATDLANERRARVRSQERAELAAHVHDSVLHTLALVRRNADDPNQVVSLARRQERELRSWLSGHANAADSLGAALDEICGTVEADYDVQVEIVKVGDCALEPALEPLIGAAREAMINAASHSGSSSIAVYVEVEPTRITLFVRDRGAGFAVDAVDEDRRGVTDSIIGRMRSHGGVAEIRSEPGAGTEVALTMPRRPK